MAAAGPAAAAPFGPAAGTSADAKGAGGAATAVRIGLVATARMGTAAGAATRGSGAVAR
jgi:hypothetical protein